MTPPMGHDILYLPPRATPRVNHHRFGLIIFLRWTELRWPTLVGPQSVDIDDRIDEAEPGFRGNL